jgi:hypothetical protein
VKEALCYVSTDFMSELQAARAAGRPLQGVKGERAPAAQDNLGGLLKKQFVLPDYHSVMKGYVKPDFEEPDAKEQVGYFVHTFCAQCVFSNSPLRSWLLGI